MAKPNPTPRRPNWTREYFIVGGWLLVVLLFGSIMRQWVSISSSDRQFTEYAEGLLQQAVIDHRTTRDIRTLLLLKAEELSIPLLPERISISVDTGRMRTIMSYDTQIRIPFIDRVLYRMQFHHNINTTDPRLR